MAQAVIEIGSEATKLLVAAVEGGEVRPHLERRFDISPVRMGARSVADRIELVAELAREAGADRIHLAFSPELSRGHLTRSLGRRLEAAGLGPPCLLTAVERGRLAFLGAVASARTADTGNEKALAVVELGHSHTAVSVGRRGQPARWWSSRPISSGEITRRVFREDPPTRPELSAGLEIAQAEFANLKPPGCENALLIGADAGLMALTCGGTIDHEVCDEAIRKYGNRFSEILAAQLDVPTWTARRLPAALLIARAAEELLGRPLQVAHGGLAEGILLSKSTRQIGAEGATHA